MPFESPIQSVSSKEELPKLPKSGNTDQSVAQKLSLGDLSVLQKDIETLERKLAFAYGKENEVIREKAIEEIEKTFSKNPQFISQGLQYEETLFSVLHLTYIALDLTRKQSNDRPAHFSDRVSSKNEDIALAIESQVMNAEESVQMILNQKEHTERKSMFAIVSKLLNSSEGHHRAYGEMMLTDHLLDLADMLLNNPRINRQDEIVNVWQEMFLRVEDKENLKKVCAMFRLVWEKRVQREEKRQSAQREKGEIVDEGREWNDAYNNIFRKIFSVYHKEFEFNKDFVLKTAVDITGLDGSEMMNEWMRVGDALEEEKSGPSLQYAYTQNLKALYELKQSSPDAPKTLNAEFGITHFGRYTRETLKRQYEERNERKSYGIIMFPGADYNGAFFGNAMQFDQLQETLGKGGYNMRIIEVDSKESIARRMISLDKKYGQGEDAHKISFAIIGGHGSKEDISFGEGQEYHERLDKEDLSGRGVKRGFEKFFAPEASAMLFSCSTGAEEGIAEEMWKQFGLSVQAPKNNAHVSQISVSFDSLGKPIFVVEYQDGTGNNIPTMHYRTSGNTPATS